MAGIVALAGLDQPPARHRLGFAVGSPALFGHWLLSYAFVDRVQPPAPVSCDQVGLGGSGRYWQAEYWMSSARDYALSLACRRRGLPADEERGFDDLPPEVLDVFIPSLVISLERDELLRALGCVIQGLLGEADEVKALATKVEPQLRELTMAWES
jgi:hypothetical protein